MDGAGLRRTGPQGRPGRSGQTAPRGLFRSFSSCYAGAVRAGRRCRFDEKPERPLPGPSSAITCASGRSLDVRPALKPAATSAAKGRAAALRRGGRSTSQIVGDHPGKALGGTPTKPRAAGALISHPARFPPALEGGDGGLAKLDESQAVVRS